MPAAEFTTWNGDPDNDEAPRRPSTDDLGGDQKEDDAEFPPDDVEHFTAAGWNQIVQQIAAMARVAAACKVELRFDSGDPYIARATAPSDNVSADTFTVTDEGAGVTLIEWPAETFPAHQCSPTGLTLFSSSTSVVTGHLEEVTNGVRVRTHVAGVATDVVCTFEIN